MKQYVRTMLLAFAAATWVLTAPSAFAGDLGGHYRGVLFKTTSEVKLPDRLTLGLRVEPTGSGQVEVRGAVRLYLGDFGSQDYVSLKTEAVSFNLITNKLTLRTSHGGDELTFVLERVAEGVFRGEIHSDLGKIGDIILGRFRLGR